MSHTGITPMFTRTEVRSAFRYWRQQGWIIEPTRDGYNCWTNHPSGRPRFHTTTELCYLHQQVAK